MNLKKILSVFICVSFFWNCAFAADNLHIYERTDKPVPEEEVIYDFSDEAQEEFDRKNLIVPTEELKPVSQPQEFTLPEITLEHPQLSGGVVYVEAGTQFNAMLNSSISSESIANSDNVSAQLISDWIVNGTVIAPEGSILSGSVVDSNRATFAMGNGKIGINFNRLMTPDGRIIPLSTNKVYIVADSSRAGKITKRVLGGVLSGVAIAAISMIFGADPRDALIRGAAIGGTVGAVSAVASKGEEVVVPEGTNLQIMLSEPMTAQPY